MPAQQHLYNGLSRPADYSIFIARQHTARDIDIANLSVRPSVCLSVCLLRSGIR